MKEIFEKVARAWDLMPKDEYSLTVLRERAETLSVFLNEKIESEEENQFIRFKLGKEYYGIPYEYVKEIIQGIALTPLPNVPAYIAGIINSRGMLVTTIDLKMFLQGQKSLIDKNTYLIVTVVEDITIGFLADAMEGGEAYSASKLLEPLISENIKKIDYMIGIHGAKTVILNIPVIVNDIQHQLEKSFT